MRSAFASSCAGTLLAAALASGCGRQPDAPPLPAERPRPRPEPTALDPDPLAVGTRPWLQSYLSAVAPARQVSGSVDFRPGVVVVDREAALESLLEVSPDGDVFRFLGGPAALRAIEPGRILLVWGVALRRVEQVSTLGDTVVVLTGPAPLSDAITRADLRWQGGVGAKDPVLLALTETDPAAALQRTAADSRPRPGIYLASWGPDQDSEPHHPEAASPPHYPLHHAGSVSDYGYTIGFGREGDALVFDVAVSTDVPASLAYDESWIARQKRQDAARDAASAGGSKSLTGQLTERLGSEARRRTAGKVGSPDGMDEGKGSGGFNPGRIRSPSLSRLGDIRVHAWGRVNGLWDGALDIDDGQVGQLSTGYRHDGLVNFEWTARLAEPGILSDNAVLKIPAALRVPMIVMGLPFFYEVSVSFLLAPGLTSQHATSHARFNVRFGGDAGIRVAPGNVTAHGQPTAESAIDLSAVGTTSLGASAFVAAVQAPRLGVGIGLLGSEGLTAVDVVTAANTITPGATMLRPCWETTLKVTISAITSAKLLGFEIPAASHKQELGAREWHRTVPEGIRCVPR